MNTLKILQKFVYALLFLLLISFALLIVASKFEIAGLKALVVESGSMEPDIPARSIILIRSDESYHPGDVITFRHSNRDDVLVTHRILSLTYIGKDAEFTTKGDANEDPDGETVLRKDVLGKVVLTIPFVGTLFAFVKTTPGFITLIVIPAVIIVYHELLSIKQQLSFYLERHALKKK